MGIIYPDPELARQDYTEEHIFLQMEVFDPTIETLLCIEEFSNNAPEQLQLVCLCHLLVSFSEFVYD